MKSDHSKWTQVSECDLMPGDHISARRRGGFYTHQGIYMGEGKVIHYTGSRKEKVDAVVTETALIRFSKGRSLRRRNYPKRLDPSQTIALAGNQLSEGSYSMLWNNCEHFATYCATGEKKSRQVKRALSGLSGIVAGAAVFIISALVWSRVKKA